jgi:hypothetical protein
MAEEADGSDETATPSSPLDKAGEFAKYLTALATGALVFSAELLKKDYTLPINSKRLLLASWICLALSTLCGLAALARIPVMMVEKTEDLEDRLLKWPLRGQQVFLPLGIVTLGIALFLALWHPESSKAEEQKQLACCTNAMKTERFAIVSSAPHILGKAAVHQHTFLLDRDTGRVWDMSCDGKNKVRFGTVPVEDLSPVQK